MKRKSLKNVLSSSMSEFREGFNAFPQHVQKQMKKSYNAGMKSGRKLAKKKKM